MKSHSLTPVEARLARQRNHYDRLHHLRRIAILSNKRRLDMVELIQLRQSRSHVAGQRPSEPSVDLDDASYLAELDRFAADEHIGADGLV
jgi:hypothetical protein